MIKDDYNIGGFMMTEKEITVKVSEGNRITIPKEICEKLEIKVGDRVKIELNNTYFCVHPISMKKKIPKGLIKKE